MDNETLNKISHERISARQIDEAIGLSRGLLADGKLNQEEVEFLQKWLVANISVSEHPVLNILYRRVNEILADGIVDESEASELFDTLSKFSNRDFDLGETLKATTLPLDNPAPLITFPGMHYCFTGTFTYGQRKECESAVITRGASAGSLTQKVNYLVIGAYATDSWKHSTFGNKISQACEMKAKGLPIRIISEEHWARSL